MKTSLKFNRRQALGSLLALTGAPLLHAQPTYPVRPIRLVVPMAAGGNGDIIARLIGQDLGSMLGQPVLIDNKPGAGGNIGADQVAKATADGYTLVLGAVGTHAINASLYQRMPYDIQRDFVPVTMMASVPNVLVVHPSLPVKTVKELIAYGKANPGKLSFASSGAGSSIHLSGEMFKSMAGVDMSHVPYKGSAPALTDLIGGQVQLMFDNLPTSLPHIKSGKLRAIAVTSLTRSPSLPDVPTLAESGLPGFEAGSWFGILAPAGTPRNVVDLLNADIQKSLARGDMQKTLVERGFQPSVKGPEQFQQYIAQEIKKWQTVIKQSGATAD